MVSRPTSGRCASELGRFRVGSHSERQICPRCTGRTTVGASYLDDPYRARERMPADRSAPLRQLDSVPRAVERLSRARITRDRLLFSPGRRPTRLMRGSPQRGRPAGFCCSARCVNNVRTGMSHALLSVRPNVRPVRPVFWD